MAVRRAVNGEKIKIPFDVPMVFELNDIAGTETKSEFAGTEYRFNVIQDGRPGHVYLSPNARNQILRGRAAPGSLIEVLKVKLPKGSDPDYDYQVKVLSDALEPSPPTGPPPRVNGRAHAAPDAPTRIDQPARTDGASTRRPAEVAADPMLDRMRRCFRVAVQSIVYAEQVAREFNVPLEFKPSDVRALAIHLSIAMEHSL